MLQLPVSPVPCISISFAPHESSPAEPKSPFAVTLPDIPDSPISQHLLPPPTLSPHQLSHVERRGQLSPLSSSHSGKGMERAKFEAMLKASKERSNVVGAKKPLELRKELAFKVQMAKQLQRRARFLTKMAEPPSPSAADIPVTPPESPAIFHFSLPSPGLESPIEVFENLLSDPQYNPIQMTIEQVDFRLPSQKLAAEARRSRQVAQRGRSPRPAPSLEQISQKLAKRPESVNQSRSSSPEGESTRTNRLPSFLQSRTSLAQPKNAVKPTTRPRLVLQTSLLSETKKTVATLPPSPKSPSPPKLQITTTICPPIKCKASPTEFTEANINEFSSTQVGASPNKAHAQSNITQVSVHAAPVQRAKVARDMLGKLSRRAPGIAAAAACGIKAQDDLVLRLDFATDDKLRRRTSAPAELPASQRNRHPILNKPGGF